MIGHSMHNLMLLGLFLRREFHCLHWRNERQTTLCARLAQSIWFVLYICPTLSRSFIWAMQSRNAETKLNLDHCCANFVSMMLCCCSLVRLPLIQWSAECIEIWFLILESPRMLRAVFLFWIRTTCFQPVGKISQPFNNSGDGARTFNVLWRKEWHKTFSSRYRRNSSTKEEQAPLAI